MSDSKFSAGALFTTSDKLACLERELRYRISTYSKLVAQGRITERQAGREIAIMGAIIEDYRKVRDLEATSSAAEPQT